MVDGLEMWPHNTEAINTQHVCVADACDHLSEFDCCCGCLLQVPITLETEVLCANQCTEKPLQPLSPDNHASVLDVVTHAVP